MNMGKTAQEPAIEKQDTFAHHRKLMKAFRKAHGPAGFDKQLNTAGAPAGLTPAATPPDIPPSLLTIRYLLNLIQKHHTVLLPKNSQN